MKKGIAFFDFDGTITTKDTLLEFIKYSKGSFRFYTGFLLNSPYLVAYKLKIISNQLAKEKVLQFFFRNMPVTTFNETCQQFSEKKLPGLVRSKALEAIKKHQQDGVRVVIVSASPENWLVQWTQQLGLELIATRLTVENGLLRGTIEGHNCHGKEKVRRINEQFQLADFSEIFAYGDSSGDRPMLALANHPFYRPFE